MPIINIDAKAKIRKIVVYAIYIILISSIQVSFPDAFSLFGQTADLMFVFVVLAGYFNGFWDGAVVGFVCGLIRDVFSPPAVKLLGFIFVFFVYLYLLLCLMACYCLACCLVFLQLPSLPYR